MTTAFESANSANKMLSSSQTPSMADSLPSINFGFEDLRDRMARFTDRFDEFIAKGRKHVLEERNQFRINMAELHGKWHISLWSARVFSHIRLMQQEKYVTLSRVLIHLPFVVKFDQLTFSCSYQSRNGKNAGPSNSSAKSPPRILHLSQKKRPKHPRCTLPFSRSRPSTQPGSRIETLCAHK